MVPSEGKGTALKGEIKMETHGPRKTGWLAMGIMVALLPFAGQTTQGQDLDTERWQLRVTPYLWAAGVDGHLKVRDTKVDVDVPFRDVWDSLDFAAMAHIEAQKGRWGLLSDVIYLALSTEKDLNVANARLDLDTWIVEFGGFYRLVDWSGDRRLPMSLDVLLGGRYWNVDADLRVGPLRRDGDASWVDPFVGLRWTGELTDWFSLYARGDVGGFGIYDDASKFTWSADGGAAFKLSQCVTVLAGYRALNIDKHGHQDLAANLTFAGPVLGLMIRF